VSRRHGVFGEAFMAMIPPIAPSGLPLNAICSPSGDHAGSKKSSKPWPPANRSAPVPSASMTQISPRPRPAWRSKTIFFLPVRDQPGLSIRILGCSATLCNGPPSALTVQMPQVAPLSPLLKAIFVPSGDHVGSMSSFDESVATERGFSPPAPITQTCWRSILPARTKAMRAPPGDQAGEPSLTSGVLVMLVRLPSAGR
jgi:hypothetical protein